MPLTPRARRTTRATFSAAAGNSPIAPGANVMFEDYVLNDRQFPLTPDEIMGLKRVLDEPPLVLDRSPRMDIPVAWFKSGNTSLYWSGTYLCQTKEKRSLLWSSTQYPRVGSMSDIYLHCDGPQEARVQKMLQLLKSYGCGD